MKNYKLNKMIEVIMSNNGVFYDYDPELLKIAGEAVERLNKRKNESWPSDEFIKDFVECGEKEYGEDYSNK